ncbi:hypothetical protein FRC02_009720 [Tulasnella sp. 418]|nr:hypothetical protein FRC02_009720 [Tulasnella sp. 418]
MVLFCIPCALAAREAVGLDDKRVSVHPPKSWRYYEPDGPGGFFTTVDLASSATLLFTGDEVTVRYIAHSSGSMMRIEIDGEVVQSVDTYEKLDDWGYCSRCLILPVSIGGLAYSPHNITIAHDGKSPQDHSDYMSSLDVVEFLYTGQAKEGESGSFASELLAHVAPGVAGSSKSVRN